MKTGPSFPRTRLSALRRLASRVIDVLDHDYSGIGGYESGSRRIALRSSLGCAVVAAVFIAVLWIGFFAGF